MSIFAIYDKLSCMNNEEVRSVAEGLGLKYAEIARLIGVSSNTFSMWMNGERNISKSNARFLKLLERRPEMIRILEDLVKEEKELP